MSFNKTLSSSDYNDPIFVKLLQALHDFHPQIKFHTFGVVKYTQTTVEKLEKHEFTFRLMTRQYNSPKNLENLNHDFKNKKREQELNQSG